MEQLQLLNNQCPGDVLMLTCAIRDLHAQFPGKYHVSIHPDSHGTDIWRHNPHVGPLKEGLQHRLLQMGYTTAIMQCNQRVGHFTQGFTRDLSEHLGITIQPRQMRPEVFLTEKERDPQHRVIKQPYWLVVAGGKHDFLAKLWSFEGYQQVINNLRQDVYFVQVGSKEKNHIHRDLKGVTGLVGRTTFRDLMRLVYHADGVVCPVTCVMHLAAAFNKPCVVLGGGREPWWWEGYTRAAWEASAVEACPDDFVEHRYLHTIGNLSCCRLGGCWMSGIGELRLGKNCKHVVKHQGQRLPTCMERITSDMVTDAVRAYLRGDPVQSDAIPDYLDTPCTALDPLPTAEGANNYHVPQRRYGPPRKRVQTSPVQSIGALRKQKMDRWK